jgi:sulfite exporter TauE/SafE
MISRFVPAVLLIAAGLLTALVAPNASNGAHGMILLAVGALLGLLGLASFLKALAEQSASRRD